MSDSKSDREGQTANEAQLKGMTILQPPYILQGPPPCENGLSRAIDAILDIYRERDVAIRERNEWAIRAKDAEAKVAELDATVTQLRDRYFPGAWPNLDPFLAQRNPGSL